MRTVRYTNRFQRDYKREKSGRHGKTLDTDLAQAIDMLSADAPLPRPDLIIPLPVNKTGPARPTPGPGRQIAKILSPSVGVLALARPVDDAASQDGPGPRENFSTSAHGRTSRRRLAKGHEKDIESGGP